MSSSPASSRPVLVLAALGIIAAVGFGVAALRTRAAWRTAIPAMPDLSGRPNELRRRVETAHQRVHQTRDAAALGELAQLYHANGFLPEAETAYHGLLRFDRRNARWPHLLAALVAGYGRLDEAIPLLQRTVAFAPDYLPARLRLGDALLKAGRTDEAEQTYTELLARDPKDPYALLGLARIDVTRERLTAAREKLSRATSADPTFFGAQSMLATLFEQLGDDDAAAIARARASQAGRFREAPDPWFDALSTYCYDPYRLQVAAATAKSTGHAAAAIPLLVRARDLAPDDVRTLRQLGDAYLDVHDLESARETLRHALEVAPNDAMTRVDFATYQLATGDAAGAQRTLEDGLTRCSDVGPLQAELGGQLLKQRQLDAAIPHLQEAVRLSPEKPEIARDLVTALFETGRSNEAVAALEAALRRHPEFPPLLVQGARYRITQRDAPGAAALMHRAEHAGASPGELARLATDYRRQFGSNPP